MGQEKKLQKPQRSRRARDPDPLSISDLQVFALLRADDEMSLSKALKIVFDHHAGAMLGAARAIIRDEDLAEDVVQEVLLGLPRVLRARGEPLPLRPYLIKSAQNEAKDAQTKLKRMMNTLRAHHAEIELDEEDVELHDDAGEDGRMLSARNLGDALNMLPDYQRRPLIMRYFAGMPPREIAAVTGSPAATVRVNISRALQRLRYWMQDKNRNEERRK